MEMSLASQFASRNDMSLSEKVQAANRIAFEMKSFLPALADNASQGQLDERIAILDAMEF